MHLTEAQQERFWLKVHATGFCWYWLGGKNAQGYGNVSVGGTTRRAHRVAYEILVGSIPEGLVVDHLCRNPSCVNPDHLEPVTPRENTLRGRAPELLRQMARKEFCKRGHPMPDLVEGRRQRVCNACRRIVAEERRNADPGLRRKHAEAQARYRAKSETYADRHRLAQRRYMERKANA